MTALAVVRSALAKATDSSGQYGSVDDLPPDVRTALAGLPHALATWRAAYNAAASDPKYRGDPSTPYQVAWAAVTHRYGKGPDGWHRTAKSVLLDAAARLRKDAPTVTDVHVDRTLGTESTTCPSCGADMGDATVCPSCGFTKAAHTGAMVALFPPATTAQALAIPGASEKPSDLHITLAYLPALPASDDPFADLVGAVQGWASSAEPVEAKLQGLGVFDQTQDGKPCTWAAVDAPALNTSRPRLISSLRARGFDPADNHSFVPHVALDYADRTADAPHPAGDLRFDRVSVVAGPRRTDLPLGGGTLPMSVVAGQTESVPLAKVRPDSRFTFAPLYLPNAEDAHGEWATPDDLQKAVWDYARTGDREITLQHIPGVVIGEWVELACWPWEHEATLTVPGSAVRKVKLPPNTPWMGVVWSERAWPLVKSGHLRGLSIEGRAKRVEADIPLAG
jgi:2'-5' RNA ligase/cation transport regulator ChaB